MHRPVQMLGLGELLWDCFPDRRLPGGAPANVAFHARQLGLAAGVVTRVGDDELGREICHFLISKGLSTDLVQIDSRRATGTVTISPLLDGSASYEFLDNSAWDFLEPEQELIDALGRLQAICFGTLAQRRPTTRNTIYQCLQQVPRNCLVVYDVNLRPPFFVRDWIVRSLERSTIAKLNSDEVVTLGEMFAFPSTDEAYFARRMLDLYPQLKLVCVTRGERGCLAVNRDELIELPAVPVKVVDTVGAGDAFTAAVVYGELLQWSLPKTIDLANRFGSLVAGKPGAMPLLTDELIAIKADLEWAYRVTPDS